MMELNLFFSSLCQMNGFKDLRRKVASLLQLKLIFLWKRISFGKLMIVYRNLIKIMFLRVSSN